MNQGRPVRQKTNATGRNDRRSGSNGATIILRRSFWLSPQISALSGNARSLLVELTAMYSGPHSNGKLFLSVRDASLRLGLSDTKATRSAFYELQAVGLLSISSAAHFNVKSGGASRARAFWLNWKDLEGRPVSAEALVDLDFCKLSKKQKQRIEMRSQAIQAHHKNKPTEEDFTTLGTIRACMARESVEVSTTHEQKNGGLPPIAVGEHSATHICYQRGVGGDASTETPSPTRQRGLRDAMARRKRPGRTRLRRYQLVGSTK